ncbi:MAG: sugar transferase [Rothia sp. (in: high G+C Gram-positive bacteria)]|nr:sugar transferase [Rothia sp. (in: high G+C Gram-positive bacteria)]
MNTQYIEERWAETRNRRTWHPKIKTALYLADALAIALTFTLAHLLSFGFSNSEVMGQTELPLGYIGTGVILGIFWFVALSVANSRNIRYLGQGNDEFRLVTKSTTYFFALIAVFSYLTKVDFARTYVILAYPIGLILLLCARFLGRRWLVRWRMQGRALSRVMIIGDEPSGNHLYKTLLGAQSSGLHPVAAYLPRAQAGAQLADGDIPTLGYSPEAADVLQVVRENNIHAVAVSTGHGLNPTELRRLGWALAAAHVALIMAPAMTDIAGPRIHTQPLNGVPLIHVHTPRIEGAQAIIKRAIDVVASGLGLILLAPLLVPVALLVKKDGGPIFFLQERVGFRGAPFNMIKFRSMVTNAEELKKELMDQNEGNGILFKMADDPRITKIGKFIRKYSIDELPQLWNVFVGDMSLVGPRPPLPSEVEQYEEDAYRRLLVKPGITGLWQVSGRSNLSWEESIRLDLYYVENWSVTSDIMILLRTVRAVFAKDGAY